MNDFLLFGQMLGRNSAYCQGAGGNASLKQDGKLFIKASGTRMSEMTKSRLSCCHYKKIQSFLVDKKGSDDTYLEAVKQSVGKEQSHGLPSMEIGMHAVLPSRYVFHLHSVYVNIFTCMKGGDLLLQTIFPDIAYLLLPFVNPGFDLASVLYQQKGQLPNIIFLKNHGLVIHADELAICQHLIDIIHLRIKSYLFDHDAFPKFAVKKANRGVSQHLFPDSVVFSSVNTKKLEKEKKQAFDEIMSASRYIASQIKKLGKTPVYISEKNVRRIAGMKQEKHRLAVFHS